jgi:DnaD/phage-associated family protein
MTRYRKVDFFMKSGCKVVDQVGEMKIEGNLVPHLWYKNITFASGKAHFVAITLLADILYWYRPTLVRDENGDVIGTGTKFKADMLQKSYQAFSDTYGFTKRQVKEAIDFLVAHHLLIREFRTITTSSIVLSNIMYVQPVAGNVRRVMEGRCHVSELVSICHDSTLERTADSSAAEVAGSKGREGSPPVKRGTYTESTSELKKDKNNNREENVLTFFKENGFGMLGGYINEKIRSWCDRLQDSLVIEAMKKAVEQGKRYWGYVEAILLNWEKRGMKSLEEVSLLDEEFVAGKEKKKKQQRKTGGTGMEELDEMLDRLEADLKEQAKRELLGWG